MNTDSSRMAFPMVAKTDCTVGKQGYQPNATFDALTKANADFLHDRDAAYHLITDAQQQAITDSDNPGATSGATTETETETEAEASGFLGRHSAFRKATKRSR